MGNGIGSADGTMLEVKPISLAKANAYIIENHRHHDKVQGHKFSESCWDGERLVGVAVVGRPVSRHLDDGETLEVTRLCTDGTYNACSILYARCAKIAKDMGYKKIITYILDTEGGTSLKASGWTLDEKDVGGGIGHANQGQGNLQKSICLAKGRNTQSTRSKGGVSNYDRQ